MDILSLGIDFGTDSARAVLVSAENGAIIGSCQKKYSRWEQGKYCKPDEADFHQHPSDYIETLEYLLGEIAKCCPDLKAVRSVAVDTTCSTPCLVGKDYLPLALKEEFSENPGAMFVLWKDKSSFREATEIKEAILSSGAPYLKHCGNAYSAEYTWAKILHQLRSHEELRNEAWGFIEEVDFVTGLLTGKISKDMKACNAPATIKGLWSEEWNGFPAALLGRLDPDMGRIAQNTCYAYASPGTAAGKLCSEYVQKYGFSEDVIVAVGAVDAHSGVIGSGAAENTLAMSVGTSACFWLNYRSAPDFQLEPDGLVGDAGSIIVSGARSTGVGLSAFGDVFAWFKNILGWGRSNEEADRLIGELSEAAAALPFNPDGVIATDHFNGRRSPFVNDSIRAGICGLSLATTAPEIFRSLVEAVAFATKASIDQLLIKGLRIDSYHAVGGVSRKSPYVMQVLADVLGRPVSICDYDDSGARGAAVFGAVAAGLYPDITTAQDSMTERAGMVYTPRKELEQYYSKRYGRYQELVRFNETENR